MRFTSEGRFELTAEQAAVLADEEDPAFLAGGFALMFPLLQRWEQLFESFRTGRGVPYNELGANHAVEESRFSSPWMRANLVPVILPGLQGVDSKLIAGAKAADVRIWTIQNLTHTQLNSLRAFQKGHYTAAQAIEMANWVNSKQRTLEFTTLYTEVWSRSLRESLRATSHQQGERAINDQPANKEIIPLDQIPMELMHGLPSHTITLVGYREMMLPTKSLT